VATISSDIIARYSADAAREVEGVEDLVESSLPRHKGVRVLDEDGRMRIELHLAVAWGAAIPTLGAAVQERVAEYLDRMAQVRPDAVDVVVEVIGPP
jgi:uncharacterized alkaline shock family protein YloU